MARINIDDSFFIDARRAVLIKELTRLNIVDYEALATGLLIRAWFYAQKYWLDGQKLIPVDEFEALGFTPLLVSKLAEIRHDGVYIRGTEKHSEWIQQRRNAGKSGSDKRWKKAETLTDSEAIANDSEIKRSLSPGIQPDSGGCPLTLTLTPTLTQRDIKNISTSKPDAGLVPAGTECSPFDLEIAKQWADHARSVSKTVRPKIPLWAKTVHDLRIIDGWSEKNIRSILEQVKTDSFWQKNGASLPNIRKRSENGLTKAENIFSSFEKRKMDKQTHSVSKSNIYQREKLEYVPAIRDTPRQVVSNKPEFVPAIRDKPNEN